MNYVKQVFFAPNDYRIGDQMVPFVAERLRTLADNTRKMLAAGIKVPLWPAHKSPGAPEGGPQQFSNAPATDNKGWMVDVQQLPDGSLEQTLEVLDDETAQGIKTGKIQFSSPEIGDYIDGLGRDFGTVIRHMALTATPRNPKQGPFEEVGSPVPTLQFSLNDFFAADPKGAFMTIRTAAENLQFSDDDDRKDAESTSSDGGSDVETTADTSNESEAEETVVADVIEESGADVPENPDMPLASSDLGPTLEAIVAHLSEQGIVLPSEWKNDDEGMKHLLTALKTKEAADLESETAKAESEESDTPEPMTEEAPPMSMQFSEEANKKIRDLEAKVAASNRADLKRKFAKLPPAIRQFCESKTNTVQFSEAGSPEPNVSLSEVAELFKKALPESMQFGEDDMEEEKPDPDLVSESESDEDADKAAEDQLKEAGFSY